MEIILNYKKESFIEIIRSNFLIDIGNYKIVRSFCNENGSLIHYLLYNTETKKVIQILEYQIDLLINKKIAVYRINDSKNKKKEILMSYIERLSESNLDYWIKQTGIKIYN